MSDQTAPAERPGLPSVAVLEEILIRSLQDGDATGVDAALKLIAVQDPHRAGELLDTIKVGLVIRGERP
jgi:hypothetical protein